MKPYPLQWPKGQPRSKNKIDGAFKTELKPAHAELLRELELMGAKNVIVSTNLLGLQATEPADCGVSVWFEWKGAQRVLACDQYNRLRKNIRAIGLTVAALRGIDRWGGNFLEIAMAGFHADALPMEGRLALGGKAEWWQVLGVPSNATLAQAEAAYKGLAKVAHPDMETGNDEWMKKLGAAIAEARELLKEKVGV